MTGIRNVEAVAIAVCALLTAPPYVGSASAQASPDDKAALLEFYNATGGPNWRNNTNWNSSEPLERSYNQEFVDACVIIVKDNRIEVRLADG